MSFISNALSSTVGRLLGGGSSSNRYYHTQSPNVSAQANPQIIFNPSISSGPPVAPSAKPVGSGSAPRGSAAPSSWGTGRRGLKLPTVQAVLDQVLRGAMSGVSQGIQQRILNEITGVKSGSNVAGVAAAMEHNRALQLMGQQDRAHALQLLERQILAQERSQGRHISSGQALQLARQAFAKEQGQLEHARAIEMHGLTSPIEWARLKQQNEQFLLSNENEISRMSDAKKALHRQWANDDTFSDRGALNQTAHWLFGRRTMSAFPSYFAGK